MSLSWSFLRLVLGVWVLLAGTCLLEQATGEQQVEDVARSLGVSDVNEWDIRSLYRVRFQHITKRPPGHGQRAAERKSHLATRWAALRERLADFFPSRHTNPRTVVTFDKIATDFVNVGIVKLAKALDPPKSTPKVRQGKKGKLSTPEPPTLDVSGGDTITDVPAATNQPTRMDVRPKRRVTLLVDLPDFDLQDFGSPDVDVEDSNYVQPRAKASRRSTTPLYPFLPGAPEKLVSDESPCRGNASVVQSYAPKFLILAAAIFLSTYGAGMM